MEVTTFKWHSVINGHVAKIAKKAIVPKVLNNDAHDPGDLVSWILREKWGSGQV